MSYTCVSSYEDLQQLLTTNRALAVYFGGKDCAVCAALLPKLASLLKQKFPQVTLVLVETEQSLELAAQLSIFSVPAVLVYLDGSLFFRQARHISLKNLASDLERPYQLLFS